MKPLGPPTNNTIQSREETTSTCVMWDGPNISFECLGVQICEGESINPIVYRSFVNLCNILDQLNLDDLNLTCLGNLINTTRSLNEIFNLLIERLCIEADKVNQLEDVISKVYTANLPYCLQDFNDQLTITKLQLPEYYQKVAVQICLYLTDIATLQNQYELSPGHYFYDQLQLLEIEIGILCGTATSLVTPTCTNNAIENPSAGPVTVDKALTWLELAFCSLRNYTGTQSDLLSAIARDCPNLGSKKRLSNTGNMDSIVGWVDSPSTLADSLNNLWLTICDMRLAAQKVKDSGCCPP
jgi:hypothetical protein